MAIPKMTDELNIISQLGDNPNTDNGLTAEELKKKFDEAPKLIKEYLNNRLVPAVQNVETAADGHTTKIQTMENSLREATMLANSAGQTAASAASAAQSAQTAANEAKQAAAAAGGMKREFNSGSNLINKAVYTTPGSLAKLYVVTLSLRGTVDADSSFYSVMMDWQTIHDSIYNGWTIHAGAANEVCVKAVVNADNTVTFTAFHRSDASKRVYIQNVVGYY